MSMTFDFDQASGHLKVLGAPDGSTVHGIDAGFASDAIRLAAFRIDMQNVLDWYSASQRPELEAFAEPLLIAAVVKFVGCFESTSGAKVRPLKPKQIYDHSERSQIDELRLLRNTALAHDEQISDGHFAALLMDQSAVAFYAVVLTMTVIVTGWEHIHNLRFLAEKALKWIHNQYEVEVERLLQAANDLPEAERQAIKLQAGLRIQIKHGPPYPDMVADRRGKRR